MTLLTLDFEVFHVSDFRQMRDVPQGYVQQIPSLPTFTPPQSNGSVNKVGVEGLSDPGLDSPTSDHSARYFVMKSNNHRNLDISNQKAIWATNVKNEKMINEAFRVSRCLSSLSVYCSKLVFV